MSVPAALIECTACDYQTTTLHTVGSFSWCDDNGNQATMTRQLGVCDNCDGVVAMELIPSPSELQAACSTQPSREPPPPKKGWLSRLLGEPKDDRPEWLKVVHEMREKKPHKVFEALSQQNRLPICLVCGSTLVQPLQLPNHEELSETLEFFTAMRHPGCGGVLIAYFAPDRRYSPIEYATLVHVSGKIMRRDRYR